MLRRGLALGTTLGAGSVDGGTRPDTVVEMVDLLTNKGSVKDICEHVTHVILEASVVGSTGWSCSPNCLGCPVLVKDCSGCVNFTVD